MKKIDLAALIIFAAIGPIAWLAGCLINCIPEYGWWTVLIVAVAVILLPVSSALHEAGHMIFGAMVKIKAVPKFKLFGSSSCQIIPQTDKNLKKRFIVTALGGLIINFLLLVFSIIAAVCLPFWVSVFFPSCWYLIALNALPLTYSTGDTDVNAVWNMAANEPSSQVLLSVLTVQAQVLNGKPIKDVDEKLLFDLPQIQEDDQAFIALSELRYEYFKAHGDAENAEIWKTRFEELKKEYM